MLTEDIFFTLMFQGCLHSYPQLLRAGGGKLDSMISNFSIQILQLFGFCVEGHSTSMYNTWTNPRQIRAWGGVEENVIHMKQFHIINPLGTADGKVTMFN